MRKPLREFDGEQYDVIAIGGGISGASSAQHLAAAGYRVLLIDKDDFASAATSRSGRLLHCGLRYLAPTYSLLDFIRKPRQFATALGAARRSILSSSEFLATTPEHAREMRLIFAITREMPYRGWHVRLGARLLEILCRGRQKLRDVEQASFRRHGGDQHPVDRKRPGREQRDRARPHEQPPHSHPPSAPAGESARI